jgi:hypothetical protein
MPVIAMKNESDDIVSDAAIMTSALSMVRIHKDGAAAECRAVIKRIAARHDKVAIETWGLILEEVERIERIMDKQNQRFLG